MIKRWRMHKLGFVNFWLYDAEEFDIEDGHLLLRGANAAGKSITTQSFIPFILDGNRSPERLDPFGSRDRKMDFYLLGDGEREEATGYLYLEFKKDGLEDYRTIGIGMRASRGKGIDFWGFCLCDGRRVDPNGIRLYETFSHQLMSTSKQKLKNALGDSNYWADSPGEYKQMINERIFQFHDIRQYEQLIQLLVKVRAPKLSKESFRPSEIKKILNSSLQILTDADLSAMVSTMERLDTLEDTLRDYRSSMRDAVIIRNEYTRYNQFILGLKGQNYLDAKSKTANANNRLNSAQKELINQKEELNRQKELLDQSQHLLAKAKAQRDAMGNDDISAKTAQLDNDFHSKQALINQIEIEEAQLKKLRDKIYQNEVSLREKTTTQRDNTDAFMTDVQSLKEQNEILLLKEHEKYFSYLEAIKLETSEHKSIKSALNRLKTLVGEILNNLRKADQARRDYDAACLSLDHAATVVNMAKSELRDAEIQEQEERDRLIEGISVSFQTNTELRFSEDELLLLRQAVISYQSSADWSSVRKLVDDCYQARHDILSKLQLNAERELNDVLAETSVLQKQLEKVMSRPVLPPPRKDSVHATRVYLSMQDIPHAAFYEAVDFNPNLSPKERDLLEAQLSDSGLLDTLFVSEEYRPKIEALISDYPDRFLIVGAPVDNPITSLIADEGSILCETARQCLRGISCSDLSAQTALLPDGRFRSGMIQGCSLAESPAAFVGAAARRANRERQINLLEESLQASKLKQQNKQDEVDILTRRMKSLIDERTSMPGTEDLDQALDLLFQARRQLSLAVAEMDKQSELERAAKQLLARLEQDIRTSTLGLPYTRTIDDYEEVSEAIDDSINLLSNIYEDWHTLQSTIRAVQDLTDKIDEQRDNAEVTQSSVQQRKGALEITEARILEVQAFLARPENQARANRLKELDAEIINQSDIKHNADKECSLLVERIKTSDESVNRINQEYKNSTFLEKEMERYFVEDLSLGNTLVRESEDLTFYARQAVSKMPASDRERTPEKVGEALRNNYQQHNNSLLKYQPKIETIFDAPIQIGIPRQRLQITLQKEGKEISLYDFILSLQKDIDLTETVLEDKDRELFEDILTDTISHKLRARIEDSQEWSRDMSALMKTLDTSMGLTFSLEWKAKSADGEEELDTAHLVTLLNKDRVLLTREDSQRVSSHFRSKVKTARLNAEQQERFPNYADLIRDVLDFRTWYDFHIYYQRQGEGKKELTDRIFNTFSGGEKAMAMYLPQFAAVSAQYQKCNASAPMMLALDEAFAGVDDKNISAMFELVHTLGFDYIMNSQALWGCYSCVSSLNIADLHRPANAQVVTILRYLWNGAERILVG